MKRQTAMWVLKAEDDWAGANALAAWVPPLRAPACFHCQQVAEKYFKALLQESGAHVPKTPDLQDLLDLLLPYDAGLAPLRRGLRSLSRHGVDYYYPDVGATSRGLRAALRHTERVRRELRARLGLPP